MKLHHHARGVTLVELLVSISIGLVIVGAMVALYVSTARSYRQHEALVQLQSNARYVFEIMGYDIRMAGNTSCQVAGPTRPANYVSNPSGNWWSRWSDLDNNNRPLFGQDETGDNNQIGDAGFPADYGGQALRGDTLIVLRANTDDSAPGIVANYDTDSTDPIIMTSGSFNIGSLLLLTDCKTTAALFQMTGNAGGIQHSTALGSSSQDMTGAKVVQLSANAYYLRNSGRKYSNSNSLIPSLYRQTLTASGNAPATVGQELVSGVTDLQILYGVDTSTPRDGVVDSYMTAAAFNAAAYSWDWTNDLADPTKRSVLAVRVTITLESADDAVTNESASFTLGNGQVISDRRLRRSYTMTFGIRQRLL